MFQSLSRRKEQQHAEEKVMENPENENEPLDPREDKSYPFAVVLRLRVLQVLTFIALLHDENLISFVSLSSGGTFIIEIQFSV